MNNPAILPRILGSALHQALRRDPVVVVTGARQTGKTTLVRAVAPASGRMYLSLDELDVLEEAEVRPDDLVRRRPRLTLDEVQRSPGLLLAIKRAVDERRAPGRFLLTGSANLLLMRKLAETLAGRATYFTLWPMTRREQLGAGQCGVWERLFATRARDWLDLLEAGDALPEDWRRFARRGGYPVVAHLLREQGDRARWLAGYTSTYLERDLQELSAVQSLVDFRRLMKAACLRLGNLVNQTELARDVGISQPTGHRYLDLLEASYQLVRVPAYAVNRTKRLIKAPKLYWSDSALAMHLAGEHEPRGPHLENLVLADLLAWRGSVAEAPEILYWRTSLGEEVDFVIEWRNRLLAVEVKAGPKPRAADARHAMTFLAEYPEQAAGGLLLHTGSEVVQLAQGVLAAPWWRVI